ncbi:MAG: hypothetical protein SFY81_04725 [Verrucomicrobiota bacterium]|nr:hypothetical protein [Verrucomicrobiota bacterium]
MKGLIPSQFFNALRAATILGITFTGGFLNAAEKLTFSDRPAGVNELPKTSSRQDELLNDTKRFPSSIGGGDPSGGVADVPPVPPPSSIQSTDKLEEFLDRKKNWMFSNVLDGSDQLEQENPLDSNEQSAFQGETRRKSLLERYVQDDERGRSPALRNSKSVFSNNNDDPAVKGSNFSDETREELNIHNYLRPSTANELLMRNADTLQRARTSLPGTEGFRANQDFQKKAEREKLEETRIAEFQKLLQPRSLSPSVSGVNDPINLTGDPLRQAANPITPSRTREALSIGRDSDNDRDSLVSSRAIPAFNMNSSIRDAISAKASAATSLAPSYSPPAAPKIAEPRPFTFEFPKRSF